MIDEKFEKKYAVALGYFDGLHTAHVAVINEAVRFSSEGLVPAVMLFDEHPRKLLCGEKVPCLIQKGKRDEILSEMGVETLLVSFEEIRDMSPEKFVKDILVKRFNAGAAVCGYNYRFGKNGTGDSVELKSLCEKCGIKTVICPEFTLGSENVSSTNIRNAVKNGEIEKANRMLGFPFGFSSEIFTGDRRGRLLGTPTINQFLPEELQIPAFGVYASKVFFDSKEYIGVTNIGSRPTFDGESVRSETYIIGFEGDLYGRTVSVELYKFLREEQKFPDADALKEQISKDVALTGAYFSEKNKKIKKKLKKSQKKC